MKNVPVLNDLLLVSPLVLLFGVALVIMLVEAWSRPASKTIFWGLGFGGLLGALALTGVVYGMADPAAVHPAASPFNGMLRIDRFGVFFQVCSILAGLLSLLMSDGYLERI